MAFAFLIGQDHRLQHIDHLSDVSHLHTIGVFVEHIQRKSCNKSIAESVLLIEVSWNGTRLLIPPCAPLINEQTNLVLWVYLIHDCLVLLNDLFDLQALGKSPIILVVVEIGSSALRSLPTRTGVIMQTDAVHLAPDILHKHFGPVVVVVAGTRSDAIKMVLTLVTQIGIELAVFVRVIFGSHVSTTAPGFITDSEVFHLPSFVATVLTAQTSHWCVTVGGHVFNPLGHFLHSAGTNITTNIRLAAKHLAEIQELVGTEAVVLDRTTPVVVTQ